MNRHFLTPFLIAFMAAIGTLSVTAQETNNHPMQGRRRMISQEFVQRRAASTQDKGPGGNYFLGEKHQLVVLASFADNPFLGDSAVALAQWNKILNAEHYDEAPFMGSLHDYFHDQSYGQFNLVCDLQFVRVDSCRRYRSTITDDENTQYLVQDIMASLKQRNIEWERYDWNGDSYVNQLLIIFAGQGSSYAGLGPRSDAIWPHQSWLSMRFKDRQQGVYCDPDTVPYKGSYFIVDAYCATQELYSDSTYGSFGTLCHEYTHCFGFPDFYMSGSSMAFIGEWDLMDSGNYCGGGFRPVGFSAHERWIMGWLTPTELTQATTVTAMPALADEPVAYLIRNDAYPDEFYMLENRQKKGWDSELPGSGLAVFHVDYVPSIWILGEVNTSNTQHYVLIPANNKSSFYYNSGWAYPYVNGSTVNNALTDTSSPAADLWHDSPSGTKRMSKPVTDIAVNDSLVSFSFMAAPSGVVPVNNDQSPKTEKILRNGQLLIRHGNKTYTLQGLEIP